MEYVLEAVLLTGVVAYISRDNAVIGEGGIIAAILATTLNLITVLALFLTLCGVMNLLD
jgi:hypothetical protein